VRITGGPDAPTVTDGPFAEGAEVAGGYYVFEAENLDEALALARDIPAAKHGAVEVWPMVMWNQPEKPLTVKNFDVAPCSGSVLTFGIASTFFECTANTTPRLLCRTGCAAV